uniref:Uncharacterized protein n=1 Tax=Arundo donax TaxID=35708 RepID=A0A0A9E2U9_ARUDO
MPPSARRRTSWRLGLGPGTKADDSSPRPRRPPSPLPHTQAPPSTRSAEWKSPQEIPTSTPDASASAARRPGVGARRGSESGSRRWATGEG